MDLNQLKSFVAVAHQGNLTQAAENLHLSQPAVSAQIKAIERFLDVQLFVRNAQGMSLTAAGSALLPEAEALLQHMHRLDDFAAQLSGSHSIALEVGLIQPLSGDKVAQMTQLLAEKLPHVHINLRFGLSGDLLNAVRKKELHAGFFLGENPYRSVQALRLQGLDYVLVCHQTQAAVLEAGLPKSLNECHWIDMSPASGSSKLVQQIWRELKVAPQSRMQCDRPSVMLDLVASGLGIAFVPKEAALKARMAGIPIALVESVAGRLDLQFVYPNEFEENPLVLALREVVAQVWPL